MFWGDFNFDIGENLESIVDGFVIVFQSVEISVTKENSLELVIGGFRASECSSEGEKVIVGLEIGLFERGFEEVWATTFCGYEILFNSLKIWVTG